MYLLCMGLLHGTGKLAEREGFEPPEGCPSTVFKTAALNHSATSPESVEYPRHSGQAS